MTGADVVAGLGGLEEGVVKQKHRIGDGRQDPIDLTPDAGMAMVTVKEEQGVRGTPRPLPEAQGSGQAVALVQLHILEAPYHHAPLGMGMFHVVDVIGEIAGMDGGRDVEVVGNFVKDPRRLADVGAPLEDQRWLKATDRRRHQHQFLEGERMDADKGNQGAGHEC